VSAFALGPPWRTENDDGWGGPPVTLVVREDAPWLGELAKAIAATISRPTHEVVVKTLPAGEIQQRKASRAFGLLLDVVRPVAHGTIGALIALATADDPQKAADLVRKPPKGDAPARALTRQLQLRLGVVGEIRAQGGRMPDAILAASGTAGVDWGASWRRR
jgi:peptide/nickel transport system substrate-binding protein